MTVLAIVQTCAGRLSLTNPSSMVGSTDSNITFLKAMIEKTAQEIRNSFAWPELWKEYTFTLSTSTASYALPGDYDRRQNETLWNRTQHWPLIGPVDAVEWQNYKSGLITTLPRQRFQVKGWATNQFYIDPTPTSAENGQTCVYEYLIRTVFRPKTWVTSTAFSAGTYCSYNGNIYKTTAGGTTGATPPTHTTGSASDGAVTWTYQSTYFETITADTDECILDNQMIIDGAVWRYKRERGFDYQELKQDAEDQIDLIQSKLSGAGVLSVNGKMRLPPMIGPWSYPEGNYGL